MLVVKGVVNFLPKSLKKFIRSNSPIAELYGYHLRSSGLFYGYPKAKKIQQLYDFYLSQRKRSPNAVQTSSNIHVVVLGGLEVSKTLDSIEKSNSKPASIVQVDCAKDSVLCVDFELISLELLPDDNYPVLFIRSGDTLDTECIETFTQVINESDIVYSDLDVLGEGNVYKSPCFFPDWNFELQLSTAYIFTCVAFRRELISHYSIAKCKTLSGAVTSLALSDSDLRIAHIPDTLCHIKQDINEEKKQLSDVASVVNMSGKGVCNHLEDANINRVTWIGSETPLVSLIIPTKNCHQLVRKCIESIIDKTTYNNYEILLIDNGSDDEDSLRYFKSLANNPKIRVFHYERDFNYSAINNFAVKHASGQLIGLVNNDIEVISPRWLERMVNFAVREDVGCVGAKLLFPDGRIQHAGVVLGYGGGAGHAHKFFPSEHPGYLKRIVASSEFSAVTAACLLVKKSLYEAVGGLNEEDLTVAFNDVDFCLKVRELGLRNIYCAEAVLYHHESVSRGLDLTPEKQERFRSELFFLQSRWQNYIDLDPSYNRNLTRRCENFSIKEKSEY